MLKKLNRVLITSALVGLSTSLFAASVEDFTNNLIGYSTVVATVFMYVSYAVGIIFCFMAIAQYQIHRRSPKLVPLGTPVLLLICGIILVALPYLSTRFNTGSPLKDRVEEKEEGGLALPELDSSGRKTPASYEAPASQSRSSERAKPAKSSAPSTPPEPERHWSDDPKYR